MMKMFKKKTRVLNAELPRPLQRNAMSTLYANLGFMSFDKPMRTIVVTSSVPNEGKTTVAVELARVMAVAGKRTLLVECDLRRRSLADRLGVRAPVGLCASLRSRIALRKSTLFLSASIRSGYSV